MTTTPTERASWTAAGSDAGAQQTYASVRAALRDIESRRNAEIFLQGSYANSTNIRADSDVDVVVMTRNTFRGSVERLDPARAAEYRALGNATFNADDLRSEVLRDLRSYYGSDRVHEKNKCILVDKRNGYVDADVVPAIQYRWYRYPSASISSDYVEGIAIFPKNGGMIVNFPKEHIKNGQIKNKMCDGKYKATVRQIKRLRNRAVDLRLLPGGIAPGYLLECMTFNVPPDQFILSDTDRLSKVVLWLKYADKAGFDSCDKIHRLFKDDPGGFSVGTAQQIVDALWEAV